MVNGTVDAHIADNPKQTASNKFVRPVENLTVAEMLLEYLKLEGATKLFGIPGGATIYLSDELKLNNKEFDFYICRQETGAAYIAHGYAEVTEELGVVLTTAGPSSTNALTGVMNAEASGVSLLHISGEVPQQYFGQGYLQEGVDARLNIQAIYDNAVKYSAVVSSETNAATMFEAAFRACRTEPQHASHVSLPNNIAGTCVTGSDKAHPYRFTLPTSPSNYRTAPHVGDLDAVKLALEELATAKKPLLFLGNGTRKALRNPAILSALVTLVEKFAIPVMTTPDGKGVFPEDHPLSLRSYGMTACSWPDLYMGKPNDPGHFDALMVIGSSLGELATTVVASDHYSKNLIPQKHFIQVDLDVQMIGRDFPITRGIVGNAGATIEAMCSMAEGVRINAKRVKARRALIAEIKENNDPFHSSADRNSKAAPIHPASLVRVMNEVIDEGHIFIDAGNCVGWSLNNFVISAPVHYHSALNMGPMGYGVGAVVGGKIGMEKLGTPDVPCVALVGDGAFMMQGAEISTAAQYGVGAVWVVLYNDDLAMVSQGMAELFPPESSWDDYYKLGAPDLVKYSEGLGAQAVAITKKQGPKAFKKALKRALKKANQNRCPQVIVAHIDTKPMPPYGWPEVGEPPCKAEK